MATHVLELRFAWECRSRLFWTKTYWVGTPTSTQPDDLLLTAFLGKIAGPFSWLQKWASCMTITCVERKLSARFILPDVSYTIDESAFFSFIQGTIVTGTQPWNATMRINWITANTSVRPHWIQLSPVPQFSPFIGIDEADYLNRVQEFADAFIDGVVTADGDSWWGACRHADGSFWPALHSRLGLFAGRARHRQRVV